METARDNLNDLEVDVRGLIDLLDPQAITEDSAPAMSGELEVVFKHLQAYRKEVTKFLREYGEEGPETVIEEIERQQTMLIQYVSQHRVAVSVKIARHLHMTKTMPEFENETITQQLTQEQTLKTRKDESPISHPSLPPPTIFSIPPPNYCPDPLNPSSKLHTCPAPLTNERPPTVAPLNFRLHPPRSPISLHSINAETSPEITKLIAETAPKEENAKKKKSPVDIVSHRDTYQLTFTTEKYVHLKHIQHVFQEFGEIFGVDCNMRRIKGRARVFVKFFEKTSAVLAYSNLKDQFEDLEFANSCVKPESKPKEIVPIGPDGKYCLRFRNVGPGTGLFANWEVRDMFSQFGQVYNVKQDTIQWCYIRFNQQQDAQDAFEEYQHSNMLESFGIAKWTDDTDDRNEEEEQTDMELFISNYPHRWTLKRLRRFFRDRQHKLQFLRRKVSGQKAFCFAKVESPELMKAVIQDLNGFEIRKDRKLIVRAKIQEMHEAIEEELKAENNLCRAQDRVNKNWSCLQQYEN